jgi:hypothetical protein
MRKNKFKGDVKELWEKIGENLAQENLNQEQTKIIVK